MTQIDIRAESFKDDEYILVTRVKQVFYLEDKAKPYWRVVKHVNHKMFSDGGVIVVEDDPNIIHFDNSSDLPLSTSLNDLDNATLHIDGQSMEVDVPPDIIDVVDEDDDIADDEDALSHDLADSDNEDLINVDDDGVDKMSADVSWSYGGDGGGKGKRKPNLGGRATGRLNTRDKTRNLSLKEITIQFELRDKQTVMPLGDHAAHWSSYIGETQFNLRPHIESPDWTKINTDIQQHLQKAYNTNKAAFKAQHWVIDPTTDTYNVKKIRRACLENITASEWDKYIQFWNDPWNIAQAAQNGQNQAKSTVISRQGSRSLARLRDEMSSTTQEYPSLIDTFFMAHTVNGEFLRDEDRRIYEKMRRLEATGTYTDDEINCLARGGKQRGHIPAVGRVLPARATASPSTLAHESTLNILYKKVNFMMSLFKSDSKFSEMFSQFESGGASGSEGCGDDEEGSDHQDDEDEDGDGPTVSLGIVAGEGIPCERSPANIPRQQVARETYPQR
uniref:F-box domain, leucine-rich repeat domain, L domain-like protein n=1 Tax=Tanacetum cinerariifolium TaxID=118510 RepID=A0A6L2JLV8_TANCI|nr:F-box domain, leucine-rich repeat domain, L domain-like protein [Tanacetum cinerariifolium]